MIIENIKKIITNVIKWFEKYSYLFSSFGLILGLIITPLTLTRIDNLTNNLWISVQLFIAILGIIVLNYLENKISVGKIDKKHTETIRFWLTLIIQFAFGNLFSTYIVFYFRSSTLSLAWPFLLLISFILIGNELWKKHYSRLTLQICTLFLSIYMFFIFSLPILVHRIGDDIFLYSGLCSILFIIILILTLWKFTKENFIKSKKALIFSLSGIIVSINAMYFFNIIPPIPLSLKEAGVYHNVTKESPNEYILTAEKKTWVDYFLPGEIYHRYDDEPVYVFSSIFSPTKFDTQIIHRWSHYDKNTKKWIVYSQIKLSIVGGRDEGYRTYSNAMYVQEGLWRVDVMTSKGRMIGRVDFEIKNVKEKPVVEPIII
ncbi:MAG: DUF2914 domain-containing protein [Candidatus Paceibacterota bacterium]|jgi:hypothetical protein